MEELLVENLNKGFCFKDLLVLINFLSRISTHLRQRFGAFIGNRRDEFFIIQLKSSNSVFGARFILAIWLRSLPICKCQPCE